MLQNVRLVSDIKTQISLIAPSGTLKQKHYMKIRTAKLIRKCVMTERSVRMVFTATLRISMA